MGKQDKLNIDLTDNRNVYKNTAQDYVVTTRDKLELVLLKTEKCLSKRNSWMTPLGLLVTCSVTLLTAKFKDFVLPSNVWNAVFILASIICFFWLVQSLVVLVKYWNKGNVEDILNKIISESEE